jgi:formylmethanofuran dehydrogenase subunit E
MISQNLLKKAIKLHGHLGPFLILGLKMGLLAEEASGGKIGGCKVEAIEKKPYLCVVDGLKAVLGNKTVVVVRKGAGIAANFNKRDNTTLVVSVKKHIIDEYAQVPWEKCEETAYEVLRRETKSLLEHHNA